MKHELTHARHDPAHCLAPGLFRSLKKGERKVNKLDVLYQYGSVQLHFKGPEPLGVDDLRVLQGLVALAGPSGLMLTPAPTTESGRKIRSLLELKDEAESEFAIIAKGSYGSLAREIGYEDYDDSRLIRQCIERLWTVSIVMTSESRRYGFRLLAQYSSDDRSGELYVALNPRIASAILGAGRYTRINMQEVRSLKGDPARLIHQRLCGFMRSGESKEVTIDKLCEYAWPDACSQATQRKRHQRARQAIAELRQIGWKCVELLRGRFVVTRPSV